MANKPLILVFVWSLIFIFFTTLWIVIDNKPPAQDQAYYLTGAESLYQTLKDEGLLGFLSQTTTVLGRKAPLISISPIPLYAIFGPSQKIALSVNIIFFVLFVIFFYLLIRKLHNSYIAFLSILIVSTMPIFYGLVRNFFVEFGLMTLVIMWLYFLLKTDSLANKKYLVFLGIVSGLGMLMKFHFFIFTALPFLLKGYQNFKKYRNPRKIVTAILLVGFPAFIVAGPWYSQNILTVLWHAKRATDPQLLGDYYYGNPFTIDVISRYFTDLINYAVSPYYIILFLIFSLAVILTKKKIKIHGALLSYFFLPFIVFFFGPNKDYRFMLPLVPFLGFLIAYLFTKVLGKSYKLAFISVAFPILVFVNSSVANNFVLKEKISLGPLLFYGSRVGYAEKPESDYFPNEQVINTIKRESFKAPSILISASEDRYLNINNLQYYNIKNGSPFEIKTVSYLKDVEIDDVTMMVNMGDFLVMRVGVTDRPKDINIYNESILMSLDKSVWSLISSDITFPDGGRVLIFKKS